jgi:hypothetical protein
MTGIEGAAAGVAAHLASVGSDAAKSALNESKMARRIEQSALVEAAKETAGFKQAADIRGRKIALREQWGLVLMKPLAGFMGVLREYFQTDFNRDFAEKIQDIPEDKLQTPKASIAGPVMEGLGYSLDEPELKEMYLELLARASDERQAETAHPSFVQTIRQITSTEARYLPLYLQSANHLTPIVSYIAKFMPAETGGYRELSAHVLNLTDADGPIVDPMLPTYVDNWVRLKLVEVSYDLKVTAPSAYDWTETRPERETAQTRVNGMEGPEWQRAMSERGITEIVLDIRQGIMECTALGYQFAVAAGLVVK